MRRTASRTSWAARSAGRSLPARTFFFGSFQRWTDRRLGSGFTLDGAPSDAGRAVLQSVAAGRPHVQALLKHLPAGTPNGRIGDVHARRPDLHACRSVR